MTKKQLGKKFDTGKSSARRGVLEYFPRAILEVGKLSDFGAKKYDWNNWEYVEDAINRYGDAEVRHICEAAISGETDPESGLLHATHAAWNALAVLEMKLREKEAKEATIYTPEFDEGLRKYIEASTKAADEKIKKGLA